MTILRRKIMAKRRCPWAIEHNPHYIAYHDDEWGVPCYDDQQLFEMLILEGAQAGLSWETILKRRDNYRNAFDHFDAEKIARYNKKKQQQLLNNAGIIRNRLKIASTISNAQAFLNIRQQYGGFSDYIWGFVDGQPIINRWKNLDNVPASTELSKKMSRELKKAGFRFVGETICYAYMQAVGMVNDHLTSCFRYREICRDLATQK
ncbi:MAG: DNA-3-methyladenine glycosylase I [Gammaproteobacteria bacterium]|nr:DNA-3-methyladenine glycosylase I [Gammaproteobacteria bacterium]